VSKEKVGQSGLSGSEVFVMHQNCGAAAELAGRGGALEGPHSSLVAHLKISYFT